MFLENRHGFSYINPVMKQVYFETFGCQMNVADTDRMELLLFNSGFRRTAQKEEADLILINSCSIREKAEQKISPKNESKKPADNKEVKK